MGGIRRLYEKNKVFIMEVINFCLVGVINTLMGLIVIEILYNIIHLNYWAASGISYSIGGVFSYFANGKVTFKVKEKDRDRGLPWRFAINIIVCYLVAYGVAKPSVKYVLSSQPKVIVENIAIILGMVLFTVMNFFGQKFLVFKKAEKERRNS